MTAQKSSGPRPAPRHGARGPAADADGVAAFLDASRALVGIAVHSVHAAGVDITVAQYRLLAVLDSSGPLTISDVTALLGVAQSNATRHVDRLQRLGLVERNRSTQDGRVVLVELTAEGRAVVTRVTEVRRQEIARVLETLGESGVRRATAGVRAFNRAAAQLPDQPWLTAAW